MTHNTRVIKLRGKEMTFEHLINGGPIKAFFNAADHAGGQGGGVVHVPLCQSQPRRRLQSNNAPKAKGDNTPEVEGGTVVDQVADAAEYHISPYVAFWPSLGDNI